MKFLGVQWADASALLVNLPTAHEAAAPSNTSADTGGFDCGWELQNKLDYCKGLMAKFWADHPSLHCQDVAELRDATRRPILRCEHCNHLGFRTPKEHAQHIMSYPFSPIARTRSSTNGVAVIAARKAVA